MTMIRKRLFSLSLTAILSGVLLTSCHTTNVYHLANRAVESHSADNTRVWSLLGESLGIGVASIVLVLILASIWYALDEERWRRFWKFIERNLSTLFVFTWIFGFCTYCVGMYISEDTTGATGDWGRLVRVAPMGVLHAFGMFLLESDVSAVHEEFHGNLFYMTMFSLVHFLAAFVSLAFVIKHFGYNIVAAVHLRLTLLRRSRKDDLYVFWGTNEPSYFLAADIKNNAPSSHRVLFVMASDEEEDSSERTGVGRLLNFLSVKNKELDNFKSLKCLSVNAFSRLSKCELTNEERENKNALLLKKKLRLMPLVKMMRLTDRHIHIFLLDDDADSNIKATINLCSDKDINDYALKGKVTIYCHARYDSVNKVVENMHYAKNPTVRIIDSAHMAIESLKAKKEDLCLPVDFVRVNEDATVSDEFNSMVVGMGQCGRDAVKFLYEYGAFVKGGTGLTTDAERSPFSCDAFDVNMKEIGSLFRQAHPCDEISEILDDGEKTDDHAIKLHDSNYKATHFWKFVEKNIKNENYIVISMKNDEEGITLAVRLLKQAIASGADLDRLRIFVRSYKSNMLQYMKDIADHYNRAVTESLHLKRNHQPIYIFGASSELYTWANIVDDSMRKESYHYYNSYEKISESEEELGAAWERRRNKEINQKDRGGYANLNAVRRKETQDMENAQHRFTKMALVKAALHNDDDLNNLARLISQSQRTPYNNYGIEERYERIMTALAQTEHLRWVASHKMLGYQEGPETNEATLRHNCLVSWNKLSSDEVRGYDFSVVETSMKMYLKEQS